MTEVTGYGLVDHTLVFMAYSILITEPKHHLYKYNQ